MTELVQGSKPEKDVLVEMMGEGALKESGTQDIDSLEERRLRGQSFYRLAKLYYDKADLESAKKYFIKCLDYSSYPVDFFALNKAYGFLVRIYSETMEIEEANKIIVMAEELMERYGKDASTLTSEYFYIVGMVYNYKGDFDRAFENLQLAYQKSQTENEPELLAKSLMSIANTSFHLHRYSEALNHLEQLKELLQILRKDYLRGSMYLLYGNVYKDMGKYDSAMENYDMAIQYLQKKNCWNLFGYVLLNKGTILKKMGDYKHSLFMFKMGLNAVDSNVYKRLYKLLKDQVEDVNDSSVDIYLDRHNRIVHDKHLGQIDFKHRFVLLEILFLLAKNPGRYFNKDDLSKMIWKEEYNPLIHDKLIYTSVSRLRKLIEPKNSGRKYILRGKDGYTFNPRVNARFHREDDGGHKNLIGSIEISSPV